MTYSIVCLWALAEKLQAAAAGSDELDLDILNALRPDMTAPPFTTFEGDPRLVTTGEGSVLTGLDVRPLGRYTTSIDESLALCTEHRINPQVILRRAIGRLYQVNLRGEIDVVATMPLLILFELVAALTERVGKQTQDRFGSIG